MDPPVPIPNTAVKRHSAHDTAPARVWENRSPPGDYFKENAHNNVGVFLFKRLFALVVGPLGSASQSLANVRSNDTAICV